LVLLGVGWARDETLPDQLALKLRVCGRALLLVLERLRRQHGGTGVHRRGGRADLEHVEAGDVLAAVGALRRLKIM